MQPISQEDVWQRLSNLKHHYSDFYQLDPDVNYCLTREYLQNFINALYDLEESYFRNNSEIQIAQQIEQLLQEKELERKLKKQREQGLIPVQNEEPINYEEKIRQLLNDSRGQNSERQLFFALVYSKYMFNVKEDLSLKWINHIEEDDNLKNAIVDELIKYFERKIPGYLKKSVIEDGGRQQRMKEQNQQLKQRFQRYEQNIINVKFYYHIMKQKAETLLERKSLQNNDRQSILEYLSSLDKQKKLSLKDIDAELIDWIKEFKYENLRDQETLDFMKENIKTVEDVKLYKERLHAFLNKDIGLLYRQQRISWWEFILLDSFFSVYYIEKGVSNEFYRVMQSVRTQNFKTINELDMYFKKYIGKSKIFDKSEKKKYNTHEQEPYPSFEQTFVKINTTATRRTVIPISGDVKKLQQNVDKRQCANEFTFISLVIYNRGMSIYPTLEQYLQTCNKTGKSLIEFDWHPSNKFSEKLKWILQPKEIILRNDFVSVVEIEGIDITEKRNEPAEKRNEPAEKRNEPAEKRNEPAEEDSNSKNEIKIIQPPKVEIQVQKKKFQFTSQPVIENMK